MSRHTRRDFLRMGAFLATSLGLGGEQAGVFADGLKKVAGGQKRVIWLQGQSCTGCSVSFLNCENPGPVEILTQIVSLVYHSNLSAAQGSQVGRLFDTVARAGDYLLVLEGSIPMDMPEACMLGGKPLAEQLTPLIEGASAVIAAGTCSSFGGLPAAEGNPTAAAGLGQFMEHKGIERKGRLVNCPGCPVHPQSLLGTVAHVAARGYPTVDTQLLTPELFYKRSVHDECPKFHYWAKHEFAEEFGDEGCLFKLGCLGPLSHTSCPQRQWNGGVNWCIRAGAPCTGCTSETFGKKRDFPFYRKGEKYHEVAYTDSDRGSTNS